MSSGATLCDFLEAVVVLNAPSEGFLVAFVTFKNKRRWFNTLPGPSCCRPSCTTSAGRFAQNCQARFSSAFRLCRRHGRPRSFRYLTNSACCVFQLGNISGEYTHKDSAFCCRYFVGYPPRTRVHVIVSASRGSNAFHIPGVWI